MIEAGSRGARAARVVAALAPLLLLASGLFGPPALAASNGGLTALPTGERSWFVYDIGPGSQVEDELVVQYRGAEPVVLWIYAADSTLTGSGGFAVRGRDEPRTGVGAWVSLPVTTLALAPGESRKIRFTLRVPEGIEPGERSGAIVLEYPPKAGSPSTVSGGNSFAVNVVQRLAVRIYERVPGEAKRLLGLVGLSASVDPVSGGAAAWFRLENRGNVSVTPRGWLALVGSSGNPVARWDLGDFEALPPGGFVARRLELAGAPRIGRFRLEATFSPAEAEPGAPAPGAATGAIDILIFPWAGAAAAAAALGLLALAVTWFRRSFKISFQRRG